MVTPWLKFQGRFTNIYLLKGAANALMLPSFILLKIKLVSHQNLSLQTCLWRIIPGSVFMCLDILQRHCVSFGVVFVVRESRAIFPQVCVSEEWPSDETEVAWFQGQSNAWLVPGKQKAECFKSTRCYGAHHTCQDIPFLQVVCCMFCFPLPLLPKLRNTFFRCRSDFRSLCLWDFARLEQLSHSQSLSKPGSFCPFWLRGMSVAGLLAYSPPRFADLLAAELATVIRKVDLNCSW